MQCALFFRQANCCKKTGERRALLEQEYGQKNGQNFKYCSSFAVFSYVTMRSERCEYVCLEKRCKKDQWHFYHYKSYQDHHPSFVVELPKQLTYTLIVH